MHKVLILWAPDTPENRRVVDAVTAAFNDAKLPPMVKRAAEATAADLTAAEIVVFGDKKPHNADISPDYNECIRFFRGITLAGRTAGFFGMGTEKASARLRKALKDTEITQSDEEPLFADLKQGKSSEVSDWVRSLIGVHQEIKNAQG